MVTLEEFVSYIQHIEAQLAKDDVLSDLLVCEDTTGWISTCPYLIEDVLDLLEGHLENSKDWISWWLWEIDRDKPEGQINNHVWMDHNDKTYKLTIDSIEALYYLITNDIDKIENKVEEEPPADVYIDPTVEHPKFTNETLYDVFMRSMETYTESEN
jgi:hypothetical protein